MKYSELVSFDPIERVIQLTDADDSSEAANLVKSYIMSDDMASKIKEEMVSQLSLDDVVDNQGVLLVGNYGTGKSHLMSVITAVANDAENLKHLQNKTFAENAKNIAGRFEVIRIEIGAVTTPLREIIFSRVKQDLKARGLEFEYPNVDEVDNNKGTILSMMEIFGKKYGDKGYLIAVDEFLDFLRSKDEQSVRLDLGFMRELGEVVKSSNLRVIFGLQEKLFDNPEFSFVAKRINQMRDRYRQLIIQKEDTTFVVSERILKKTEKQKAIIRDHLHMYCTYYSNMSERIEEYVSLYPIHPTFIDVFNKLYIIENRHILANISTIVGSLLDDGVPDNAPGIVSFDSYWSFIKNNVSYRADPNIKEVIDKSGQLEDIVKRSFPKKDYEPLALKVIYALSIHRLTTGDIQVRTGLTSEHLRDDLCLYLPGLPDQSSDTLQTLVQVVLKDIMTTVSGQFIDYDSDNEQYYLDLKKDIDYDEKITQRAATLSDDKLNSGFFDVIYFCMEEDKKEYVPGYKIYDYTLNWDSHRIFRRGYLFLGKPEDRSTAQPPEDYYIYFIPPYGNVEHHEYISKRNNDEVFFIFKPDDEFKSKLKLYTAANMLYELADEKNKSAYKAKAESHRKWITRYLLESKNTCFNVIYEGVNSQLPEVLKGRYKKETSFKDTMDLVASLLLDSFFAEKYPEFPAMKTKITEDNRAEAISKAIAHFSGRKEQLGNAMLDSFGLLSGDSISIQNSLYAKYYAKVLDDLPHGTVLNFNEVYKEIPSSSDVDIFFDKKFDIGYSLLSIVFLGLVHAGKAVITLKDGETITASSLDNVFKLNASDIHTFKHISKPKGLPVSELIQLYKILDIPEGFIRVEQSREDGVDKLQKKAQDFVNRSVLARTKLDSEGFELWGEKLITSHKATEYKASAKNVGDILGNFHSRFNSVAKLNNFTYSIDDIEKLGNDINNVNIVSQYVKFADDCKDNVNYMVNIESIEMFKERIGIAKTVFRGIRDEIANGKYGETAAMEVNEELEAVKSEYINIYFDNHNKHRLDIKSTELRSEIISSTKYSNLRSLAEINILSNQRLEAIVKELTALTPCFELTPQILKTYYECPKCRYQLGADDLPVKGAVEKINEKLDTLIIEWTNSVISAITDPLVIKDKEILEADKKKLIDRLLDTKTLPEKVDSFFVKTISEFIEGFDAVTVDGAELIETLSTSGPYNTTAFKAKIDEYVTGISKGKDPDKLRIIVK